MLWSVSQLELEWAPERSGAFGGRRRSYAAVGDWVPVLEPARYLWTGTRAACDALERGRAIEVHVTAPCCDVLPPLELACATGYFEAGPLSQELQADLPALLQDPLRLEVDPLGLFFRIDERSTSNVTLFVDSTESALGTSVASVQERLGVADAIQRERRPSPTRPGLHDEHLLLEYPFGHVEFVTERVDTASSRRMLREVLVRGKVPFFESLPGVGASRAQVREFFGAPTSETVDSLRFRRSYDVLLPAELRYSFAEGHVTEIRFVFGVR